MNTIADKILVALVFGFFIVFINAPSNMLSAQDKNGPPFYMDRWDPGRADRDNWSPGMMRPGLHHRMTRHWTFMHGGMPSKYQGLVNPLGQTQDHVQAGGMLYHQECAVCHGPHGMGDGELAFALTPSPALLAYMIQMPMSVDEYLFWSINEGGKGLGTEMPPFEEKLSPLQIWEIITFMRAGFPAPAKDKKLP